MLHPLHGTPMQRVYDDETGEMVVVYMDEWTPESPYDPMTHIVNGGTRQITVRIPVTSVPVEPPA